MIFLSMTFFSIFVQLIYLIPIKSLKQKLENFDFNPKIGGMFSYTGMTSLLFILLTVLFQFEAMSFLIKPEDRPDERSVDREYRHKQQFQNQAYMY